MLAFPEPCLPSASGFAGRSTQTRERSQLRASRERVTSQRQMPQPNTNVGDRIRSILALKGLTLSRASQISESLYGRFSPYFVPHNFYYDLRAGNFSPSIHQLVALSRITGYRLPDWVRVFGADLENIVRFQVELPSRRTILLDSSLVDPHAWVRWFENREWKAPLPPVAPLGQLLKSSGARKIRSLLGTSDRKFLYAKIGQQDALAYPELVPGTIVRVDPNIPDDIVPRASRASTRYFLIEHSEGLFCCHLRAVGGAVLVPVSAKLSYAQIELQRPKETRLIGVVDLTLRPALHFDPPEVPTELARQWKPRPLSRDVRSVAALLRHARATMHVSLREASEVSRRIADILRDARYYVSPSSLCDYELHNTAPRRIQTAITLCSLYGLPLQTLLEAMRIDLEDTGTEPMPDQFGSRVSAVSSPENQDATNEQSGFLGHLLEQSEEVPFFLRQSMEVLSGLGDVSLNDFFWVGGRQDVLHPYLENGLLALVNRRLRRPVHFASKPLCQQPVYVLLKRDGTYLCACCSIENGTLVVHPYAKDFHRADVFRYHHDVEVIGQIVMIAGRLV